jgi:hypothetical protein
VDKRIAAANPEPPLWRLIAIDLPPPSFTRPPRVFLAKEDRRIWRYTSPRFRGIPRLCSPPVSPSKRRLDDAATQTLREDRVHRGTQKELSEADSSGSEWEPREAKIRNLVPTNSQAIQIQPTTRDFGAQVELPISQAPPRKEADTAPTRKDSRRSRSRCRTEGSRTSRLTEDRRRDSRRAEAPARRKINASPPRRRQSSPARTTRRETNDAQRSRRERSRR